MKIPSEERMSEIMKVEAEEPRELRLVPPIPAASTSELEQQQEQDRKDLIFPIHQILVIKEEDPHDWSTSLDQQDTMEEEEKQWIDQEEERLTVKSEDEVKPQLSELHQVKTEDNGETEASTSSSADQMKREPDGEDCGGPEPDKESDPVCSAQQNDDDEENLSDLTLQQPPDSRRWQQ
ncbi:hypothetical protein CHARACLAT_011470 [Characodon lateralis]|uniref:Uncharacterized protein n=1 Tax=Characodon lateralis TaxID=208331 RepID=A0ABU7DQA1_9TELE|nr:hypothetical protein [Characodon lateralis]